MTFNLYLVLEIAAGVVLGGLILQLLKLRKTKELLAIGVIGGVTLALVIGVLIGFIWVMRFENVQMIADALVCFVFVFVGPMVAVDRLLKKAPALDALIAREVQVSAPNNSLRSLGVKAAITLIIATLFVISLSVTYEFVIHAFPKAH